MNYNKYLIVFLLCIESLIAKAQDPHFSQFYAAGLYLNPAIAGTEPGLMAGMNYRNQWRSIVVPYVTSQLTVISPLYSGKGKRAVQVGGLGLSVYNDKSGDGSYRTLGVNINGAYNLRLSSLHVITFGVQGGFIQTSVNYGDLHWGDQFNPALGYDGSISPSETGINAKRIYPDIGAGTIYSFRASKKKKAFKGFVGGSVYHINRPNESLVTSVVSRLPSLFKMHAGVSIPIADKFSLSPNVLAMLQNNVFELNTGLYLNYEINDGKDIYIPSCLVLGSWYRIEDSFIFLMGFGNKNYLFGFSYDLNNSSLRYNTNGRGAFEFSLSIRKFRKTDAMNRFHTPRI